MFRGELEKGHLLEGVQRDIRCQMNKQNKVLSHPNFVTTVLVLVY